MADRVAYEDEATAGAFKDVIKFAVLENPHIRVDDLIARLEDLGFNPSRLTTAAIVSEFKHTLKLLRTAGLLRE